MNPPKALPPDERECLRRRIRSARYENLLIALDPAELERILDAYEAMCAANRKLLDKAYPPRRTT